jgi:erythromycin esterase
MKLISSLTLCFLLGITGIRSQSEQIPSGTPLSTVDPTQPLDDLLPLKDLLSSKQVVALGEATHGSSEFFQMKHRMMAFLAEHCGFRIFAMEASYGACLPINDFVSGRPGQVDSLVWGLELWPWQTEEMKAMILWMRTYNAGKVKADQVRFYGFDVQSLVAPLQYLDRFVQQNDPSEHSAFSQIIAPAMNELRLYKALQGKNAPALLDTLQDIGIQIEAWMVRKSALYGARHDHTDLMACVRNYGYAVSIKKAPNLTLARDSLMAVTVQSIAGPAGQKMMLWAHNFHISKGLDPGWTYKYVGYPMGYYLKKEMGAAYYPIGFVFREGAFRAIKGPRSMPAALVRMALKKRIYWGLKDCYVPPLRRKDFRVKGQAVCFIDMENNKTELFSQKYRVYDVGAVFLNKKRSTTRIRPVLHFDGLIYVEKVSPAHPLRFPK